MVEATPGAATSPRLVVALPNYGWFDRAAGLTGVVDLARAADDAGVDVIAFADHVVYTDETAAFPFDSSALPSPEVPWLEPLLVFAAVASLTDRVRFLTDILIAPLRGPGLLAKQAATLDHLSNGRLELGVAAGWLKQDYDACGRPFDRRGRDLTRTLAACRALWEGPEPLSFKADDLMFERVWAQPKPVQARLPVHFAGTLHRTNQARIVDLGDGWISSPTAQRDEIAAGVIELRARMTEAGRDPGALRITSRVTPRDDDRYKIDRFVEARLLPALSSGITDVQVQLTRFADDVRAGRSFLDALGRVWDRERPRPVPPLPDPNDLSVHPREIKEPDRS